MKDWVWVWHLTAMAWPLLLQVAIDSLLPVMRRSCARRRRHCKFVLGIHNHVTILKEHSFVCFDPAVFVLFWNSLKYFSCLLVFLLTPQLQDIRSTQFGQFQFLWNISPLWLFVLLERCPWTLPDVKERGALSLLFKNIFFNWYQNILLLSPHISYKIEVTLKI